MTSALTLSQCVLFDDLIPPFQRDHCPAGMICRLFGPIIRSYISIVSKPLIGPFEAWMPAASRPCRHLASTSSS